MVFSGFTEPTSLQKMINKSTFFSILQFLPLVLFFACHSENNQQDESILSGKSKISADESFKPITEAEINTYNAIYDKALIEGNYKSEMEAVKDLLNDSVEVVVIGRDLDSTERNYFKSKAIPVKSYKFCTDAIALVVHESFPDSVIHFEALSSALSGKELSWKSIHKSMPDSSIQLIIDRSNSSNLHSINNLLTINLQAVRIYAAGSNRKVLDFVRGHKTSLGLVGASWINDLDDGEVKASLKGLKVLSILQKDSTGEYKEYSPFQSQLGIYGYPLSRDVYIVSQNKNRGPGTGFVSFALSDRGQRIVLKSGLLPARMPGRQIEVTK
jgi:phosphate transport system substrate-binding protein